jgi:AcrR family transcriptional regulator
MDTDERRAQLVALAIAAFGDRPYDDVSIDDIAAAAGVSKGLLYHYFPTKKDLYVAGIHVAAGDLLARVEPDPSLSPLERATHGVDAYLAFVEEHASAYVALMRGGVGNDRDVQRVVDRCRARILEKLLSGLTLAFPGSALASPEVRAALRGWIGYVETLSLDWLERRDLARDRVREMALEVLLFLLQRHLSGATA